VLGFLSKMTASLGLGKLVDAFILLKQRPGLETLRLRAMGGITGDDVAYVDSLRAQLDELGLAQDVEFLEEVDRDSRLAFVSSLTLMCVPMSDGEAFGTFMLEAWAAGVPVLEPRAGGFPELVEKTGGGVLYDSAGSEGLADAIQEMLENRDQLVTCGERGRAAAHEEFGIETIARQVGDAYNTVCRAHRDVAK
jgi:glycosyltransferase involved in cell wall biosynthesis